MPTALTTAAFAFPTSFVTADHDFANVGNTDYVKLCGDVVLQVTGTGQATIVVERSNRDPGLTGGNQVEVWRSTLNLDAQGAPYEIFTEPYSAWWRVRVEAVSKTVSVSLAGGVPA